METETIQKNEASQESHTSRKNNGRCVLTIIILVLFLYTQNLCGQINLIHTMSHEDLRELVSWDENINLYRGWSSGGNSYQHSVTLYNFDFSLYKTVRLTIGSFADYNPLSSVYYSKYIFNNDDKIEILVEQSSKLRLFNEDGELVYDFGVNNNLGLYNISWNPKIFKYQDNYYLSFNRKIQISGKISFTTETYALPGKGNSTDIDNVNLLEKSIFPFPNPSSTEINLPYKLEAGETSIMYIYDVNGQLIVEKQIDSVFDRILLNVSNYKKGVYFYKVKNITNKFIVN